jgi:hypothetical protein
MKILAVSDVEIGFVYSSLIREKFSGMDLAISCGDLPYYYLEYIQTMLDIPLYFVRGNHSSKVEFGTASPRRSPWGANDLHHKFLQDDSGLLLAGLEGSIRYNKGPHQYTQAEYWSLVFRMVPGFLLNKAKHNRYIDIMVTHAPPWHIHDDNDLPHQGIKAFNWLIKVFEPAFLLHGHVHVYRPDTITRTLIGKTTVLNVFGYREITLLDSRIRPARR